MSFPGDSVKNLPAMQETWFDYRHYSIFLFSIISFALQTMAGM